MIRHLLPAAAVAALLSACAVPGTDASPSSGRWSLREALGVPVGPSSSIGTERAALIANYRAQDAARLQAGLPALFTSTVTVYDGEARMPVGGGPIPKGRDWRPTGVGSVNVTECETVTVPLPRLDKPGQGFLTVSRAQGLIYIGAPLAGLCEPPAFAQALPLSGRFPLDTRGQVRGAVVDIQPFGGYAGGYVGPRW